MTHGTVARRYANALFEMAHAGGGIDVAERELKAFSEMVAAHAELRRILSIPAVEPQKKRAIVEALLTKVGQPAGEVARLLTMLADRDRLMLLPEIAAAFSDRLMQERHVLKAEVTTAVPLPDAQRASLVAALRRASGSEVAMTEKVDAAIVGGVIARVGSVVFDGSVTRQLERMKQRLLTEG